MQIKLTAPNGEKVEIESSAITSKVPNSDGIYHHNAKTVLTVGGEHQAVVETIDEIDALIKAGG